MKTGVCVGVVSVGLAVGGLAQSAVHRLNDFAVTNEFGQIVVLHDGEGYHNNDPIYAPDKSFDGDVYTFYDGRNQGGWAGFELQSPKVVTRVRYVGREGYFQRHVGTLIQGANMSDFSDAETLWTIDPPGWWNPVHWRDEPFQPPATMKAFSFVRFYCPNPNSMGGNFGEMEFYGVDPLQEPVPEPPVPVLTFAGSINWRMNLCWAGEPSAVIMYEIQRKMAHDQDFLPLTSIFAAPGEMRFMDATLLMYQDAEYRVRALNPAGGSAWAVASGHAHNGATGQWIGSPGSYGDNGNTGRMAFDGNVTTDINGPVADGFWTGLDFGVAEGIVGVRFVPRRAFPARMNNGWFEVADNPDFTNAVNIHTITASPHPSTASVTEAFFATPAVARYARYCSPNGGYGDAAEVEFVLAPAPRQLPDRMLSLASGLTNEHALLEWRMAEAGSLMSSVMVYRATSPGGPYALMTPEGIPLSETGWTDTSVVPGIRYYYKVSALLNTGTGGTLEGKMTDAHVSFIPYLRLERDWSDLTQIKPGMSLLGLEYPPYSGYGGGYDIATMFDNSLSSFPDTSPENILNPAVGVDLGKPHSVQFMRFAPRGGFDYRLNGAELRGSNDPDYTNSFTRLATFAGAANNQITTLHTETQEPFRYIFVQRPDENPFFGNIAELELYGWDPAAIATAFRAPEAMSLSIQPNGIRVDWTEGLQQDTYRIQRSADGVTWADDLADVPGFTFTDTAPLLAQRAFYRVAAVRGTPPNEELAFSDTRSIVAYTPGNGTGLWATYYTDFFPNYSHAEAFAAERLESTPNWSLATSAPIYPEIPGTSDHIRIVWNGTLTIPFSGDWTFYATSDDGVVLSIGGEPRINRWVTRGPTTDQVTLPLTAGEHPIRLDYFNEGGGKAMILEWGGAVDRAVIPATQLKPLALPPNEGVCVTTGEWQGRTFGLGRRGFHTMDSNGAITIGSADNDIWNNSEGFHYVWQTIRGDFIFEAKADTDIDPLRPSAKAMLMVRDDLPFGSPFIAPCFAPQHGYTLLERMTPHTAIGNATVPWVLYEHTVNPIHLRVKREKGAFTLAFREPSATTWETYATLPDTHNAFGKDLYIGLAVSAFANTSPNMFQTVTFSEISIKKLNGTILILK